MKLRGWLVQDVYPKLVVTPYCANKAREAAKLQRTLLTKAKEDLQHPWLQSTIAYNIVTEMNIIVKLLLAQDSIAACESMDAICRLHMVQPKNHHLTESNTDPRVL